MELNWTTFILEIINFLVLLWLLKRFLYKPVMDVITRRRDAIATQLEDARCVRDEARADRERYENRLQDWQRERDRALQDLNREMEEERNRRREALVAELAAQTEKDRALREHREAESARRLEQQAMVNATGFASRLLQQVAGPELEGRLVELALAQLVGLSAAQLESLRDTYGMDDAAVVVSSAYPLDQAQREDVSKALAQLLPATGECRFEERPELLAGLCITLGGWRLGFNLRDELRGFTDVGANQ